MRVEFLQSKKFEDAGNTELSLESENTRPYLLATKTLRWRTSVAHFIFYAKSCFPNLFRNFTLLSCKEALTC